MTRIQKWGNSQGVRLSKEVLEAAGMDVGDDVDVTVQDGVVLVTPARRVRGRVTLEGLLGDLPADHKATEVDWGPPVGGEVW